MDRRSARLLAGTCAGAVVAMLGMAAAVRPPGPAESGPLPVVPPALTTSVATTATAAPPETSAKGAARRGREAGKSIEPVPAAAGPRCREPAGRAAGSPAPTEP
ncbi:hypothetical protein AB0M80_39720 [Amycolatopsis sp. NPDC051045]|uniref:hypothetical protein n=1 Tax=Amycolatopsis sp. NPDC051045 TaxID=3156922 RepID=UPI00341E819E